MQRVQARSNNQNRGRSAFWQLDIRAMRFCLNFSQLVWQALNLGSKHLKGGQPGTTSAQHDSSLKHVAATAPKARLASCCWPAGLSAPTLARALPPRTCWPRCTPWTRHRCCHRTPLSWHSCWNRPAWSSLASTCRPPEQRYCRAEMPSARDASARCSGCHRRRKSRGRAAKMRTSARPASGRNLRLRTPDALLGALRLSLRGRRPREDPKARTC